MKGILLITLFLVGVLALPAAASANHSWGGYHWARAANPFTLKLGDNVSGAWDSFLSTTSSDWTQSAVLDTSVVPGLTNSKNCRATRGRVEVCNNKYGNNGWLGLAQIWVSGTHIVQGVTKLNDTYFNTSTYNTSAWRNLVMCQEVGHTLGLDHQDEIFNNLNLGTCMDYTRNPSGPPSNEHPNAHDYEQLETIYAHLDSTTTVGQSVQNSPRNFGEDVENRSQWGKSLKDNGKVALFMRDFGGGFKLFTFVIFAE